MKQDDRRPDPEALLRRIKASKPRTQGGKLRIYLGAAPGVGKTYEMLQEGQRLKGLGRDVVIGYVETYTRPATRQAAEGLEQVPRARVEYRGVYLEEMDLDAVIARRPEIALVDELAHTNAPGSRNAKRWQDVQEILNSGISVFTTLNIQHLESLNDVVEGITGVRVTETVPDTVVDFADEIEVVDISPARLRQRLEEGHVYPAAQAQQAMKQFFREGNLGALRELVLQRAALEVKQQLQTYMQEHELSEWETGESVLVFVDGPRGSERAIRRAWRLAHALGGELTAAIALRNVPAEEAGRLATMAEDLNAKVRKIDSRDNVVDALSMIITAENISHLVVSGRRRKWWEKFRPAVAEQLLGRHPNLSVHLVSSSPRSGQSDPDGGRPGEAV